MSKSKGRHQPKLKKGDTHFPGGWSSKERKNLNPEGKARGRRESNRLLHSIGDCFYALKKINVGRSIVDIPLRVPAQPFQVFGQTKPAKRCGDIGNIEERQVSKKNLKKMNLGKTEALVASPH